MHESSPQPEPQKLAEQNEQHESLEIRLEFAHKLNKVAENIGFVQTPEMESLLNEGNIALWTEKANDIVEIAAHTDKANSRKLYIASNLIIAAFFSKIDDLENYQIHLDAAYVFTRSFAEMKSIGDQILDIFE